MCEVAKLSFEAVSIHNVVVKKCCLYDDMHANVLSDDCVSRNFFTEK